MTRQECETMILEKMQEIVDLYHQYNPNGKYLNLTYLDDENDGYIMCNNRHWKFEEEDMEDGDDVDFPIACDNAGKEVSA